MSLEKNDLQSPTGPDRPEGMGGRKTGILIGIGGGSGAGKSTISKGLVEVLGGTDKACVIELDYYYKDYAHLPLDERAQRNFDHPDAYDLPLLRRQIRDLVSGKTIDHPIYDYRTHTRSKQTCRLTPHQTVILEGILVFHDPGIRELMDLKVFVECGSDIRFIRRLQRDLRERARTLESVVEQWERTVRPMFQEYIEPGRKYADLCVSGEKDIGLAVDTIRGRIAGG